MTTFVFKSLFHFLLLIAVFNLNAQTGDSIPALNKVLEIEYPSIEYVSTSLLRLISTPSSYIVDGYTDKPSYNPGDLSRIFINATSFVKETSIYLYTINDTKIDSVITILFPQVIANQQPWRNGFGYQVTFTYLIPHLKSGVYYWDHSRKIFFIVKDGSKSNDITIVYPTNTEAAYNNSGGKSLYDFNSQHSPPSIDSIRSSVVSFQRPLSDWVILNIRSFSEAFLQWLNKLNYKVQMIADVDMDDYTEIAYSKLLIVIGHSEYWSRKARLNFDEFVNSGKNAMVLSGNTMWWQVRYSTDKSKLICYKNSITDTISNVLFKTINWPTASLKYPVLNSIGVDFIHGAYGMKPYHGWYGYKILKPDSPLLEGTNLKAGDIVSCQSQEYDGTLYADTTSGKFVTDSTSLGFCKIELVGYDWGKSIYKTGPQKSFGTFIAFQKTSESGKIINTAFSNWCSKKSQGGAMGGFGGKDSALIKQISLNMMNKLLHGDQIFTTPLSHCGLSTLCNCPAFGNDLNIYPNPSNGKFTIVSSVFIQNYQIEIFNLLGKCVFKSRIQNTNSEIELSKQPNGIYFLKIYDGPNIYTKKVLIQ